MSYIYLLVSNILYLSIGGQCPPYLYLNIKKYIYYTNIKNFKFYIANNSLLTRHKALQPPKQFVIHN
ncbi:hypothetical protein NUACC26_079540 [Scytonema sp. NUACC26]